MSDNTGHIVQIPHPERRSQMYAYGEVYGLGNSKENRHVVNIGDIIIDAANNHLYWVIAVTPDGIPTIQALDFNGIDGVTRTEVVLGTGPGLASEGYRLYVNNKVIPHHAFIDSRVVIAGAENSYVKFFKGFDITATGEVVSGIFNSAAKLESENIPLERVTLPHYGDNGYKVAAPGYVTQPLVDGDTVTVVVYTNSGEVTSRFRLIIVNTEFIRNVDASNKRITAIALITPYLSENDAGLVEIPLGMVAQSSSFMARVTYSDGSTSTTPVDGQRFSLHGYETFVSSNLGEITPVVLNYDLSKGETSTFAKEQAGRRFITKPYRVKTVESDSRYKVKLYITPYWDKVDNLWRLDYWLYNLDRDMCIKVNDMVEIARNSKEFNGKNFGALQELSIAINLDRLGPTYQYERHIETISITLHHPISLVRRSAYYSINYGSGQMVGPNAVAYASGKAGNWTLDLTNGMVESELPLLMNYWYYNASPLLYPFNEDKAPAPTHVRIVIGNWVREVLVTDLMKPIKDVSATLYSGIGVNLEFVKISNLNRLELGKVSLIAILS